MSGIFISHAAEELDTSFALRMQRELERAGLTVWRRETCARGDAGVPPAERALTRCNAFVLLDSPRARASTTVRDDCIRTRERRTGERPAPRIIVCPLEPNGHWRYDHELLDEALAMRHVNLAPPCAPGQPFESSGDACYAKGMTEFCRLLGVAYAPAHARAREADFIDELSMVNVRGGARDSLVDDYSRFRNYSDHGQLRNAKTVLVDICARLETRRVALVTPLIALGALNAALCDDVAAEAAFADAARAAPKDSRAWAGLGAARRWQRKHARANEAYDCAVRLVRRSNDSGAKCTSARVYVDAAFVATEIGKYHHAVELLDAAERVEPSSATVLALRGRALLRSGAVAVAYETLEAAFAESAFVCGMGSSVAIDLADCAATRGDFKREMEVLQRALYHDPEDDVLVARAARATGPAKISRVGTRRA